MADQKRSRRDKLVGSLRRHGEDGVPPEAPVPPNGPTVRRAAARDLAPIVALRALMFEAMGADAEAIYANAWQLNTRRWIQVHLGSPRVHITVAEVNGSAVACAIGQIVERMPSPGNPDGRVGTLGNVATFPEYRMAGLGKACVDAVMTWFREETKVTGVELYATPEARRIYLAHGFTDHEFPNMRLHLPRE